MDTGSSKKQKPLIAALLLALAALSVLTACTAKNNNVSLDPMKIYDVLPMYSGDQIEYPADLTIDGFPGEKFYLSEGGVYSADKGLLLEGHVESLYIADVNGDGNRDLCATCGVGGVGITNFHYIIKVYDLAGKRVYTPEDWGFDHYFLFMADNKLCLGKYDQKEVAVVEAGPLIVKDEVLTFDKSGSYLTDAVEYFEHSYAAVFVFGYDRSIETLRDLYPYYFGLDASKGLTVFANSDAPAGYGILAGKDGGLGSDGYKKFREYNNRGRITPADIERILSTYNIPDDQIVFRPLYDPAVSRILPENTLDHVRRFAYLSTRLKKYQFGDLLQAAASDKP